MDVVLVMFRPGGRHRSFPIHKPQTVIGRREDCDLRIPLGEVSRKHCRLKLDVAGLQISDLGSSNGTYVNGRRVTEEDLDAGDTIRIGSLAFVVQIDGKPPTGEIDAPAEKLSHAGSSELQENSTEVALMPTAQSEAADSSMAEELEIFDDDELGQTRPERP